MSISPAGYSQPGYNHIEVPAQRTCPRSKSVQEEPDSSPAATAEFSPEAQIINGQASSEQRDEGRVPYGYGASWKRPPSPQSSSGLDQNERF
jgi:hypothetical protein